jgi:hypothetical protein
MHALELHGVESVAALDAIGKLSALRSLLMRTAA